MTAPEQIDSYGYGEVSLVGTLWRAYRLTARHLGRMLVPAAIILVPLYLAAVLTRIILLGKDAAIVNHDLQPVGGVGLSGEWRPLFLLVAALGLLVSLAACVVMAGGQLRGRSMPVSAAMATVLRRLPALAVLLAMAVLLLAPALAAARLGAPHWLLVALAVSVPLIGLPFAVVVPAMLVERRGLFRALGRAVAVTRTWRVEVGATLLVGMVVVPALAGFVLEQAIRPVSGLAHTVLEQLLVIPMGVVAVPFAAATLAAVYLAADREWTEPAALPAAGAGRGLIYGGLLVGLALPGLLHGTYLGSNPLDLPVVTDRVLLTDADGYRGAQPRLHHGADNQLLVLWAPHTSRSWSAGVLRCDDLDCVHDQQLTSSDRGDFAPPEVSPWLATASLPDGSLAIAAWLPNRADRTDGSGVAARYLLGLGECRVTGCGLPDPASAPILADGFSGPGGPEHYLAASVAARPEGGVVVAFMSFTQEEEHLMEVGLTTCADVRCGEPETVVLARDVSPFAPGIVGRVRPLDVAVAQDGTVVVAVRNLETGAVMLHACDPPGCQQPTVTTVVGPTQARFLDEGWTAVEVVVRPDGAPVLAYVDARDGVPRLLVCHTRDCTDRSDVALAEPGRQPPALAMDREGRSLVATYEQEALVLVRCVDAQCVERETLPLVEIDGSAGRLDLTLTADGRPQILWADSDVLRLTTCATPACR